jgi:competence factor transport accessory protein ComB
LGVKTIAAGTPIAQIYPAFSAGVRVAVTTYISSRDIAGVSLGQAMRLSVAQSLPQPLVLSGKVTHIDTASTALSSDAKTSVNYFKVQSEVVLSREDLSKVRYGLQGEISIIIGQKTYFNYFKDKILGNSD